MLCQREIVLGQQRCDHRDVLARPARPYVFDVLAIGNLDLCGAALRDRRIALKQLLATPLPAIVLSDQLEDGLALYKAVIENELEGAVGKRLGSQ